MFCAIRIKERNKTLAEKLFSFIFKDEYKVTTVPVYKAAPFFLLDVTVGRKGPDAENIISLVGKCASRLVTASADKLPQENGIGVFKSRLLYDKMMKNTLHQILKNNCKATSMSISIVDPEGLHKDFVLSVCGFAKSLSIVTENKTGYMEICDEIIEKTGLCPVLKNDVGEEKICINTVENEMTVRDETVLMKLEKGEKIIMPEVYSKIIPDGIPELEFFSALYELCGAFELGNCIFENITVNNEKKRVADIHFT